MGTVKRQTVNGTPLPALRPSRRDRRSRTELVEVTPDKKVVWVLRDWADLGPATAVQILDDPGIPENPGESQH
jgi:hypothetical protein